VTRPAPIRCWSCETSRSSSAADRCCAASTWPSSPARCWLCSGRTAPASPRWCAPRSGWQPPAGERCGSSAPRCTTSTPGTGSASCPSGSSPPAASPRACARWWPPGGSRADGCCVPPGATTGGPSPPRWSRSGSPTGPGTPSPPSRAGSSSGCWWRGRWSRDQLAVTLQELVARGTTLVLVLHELGALTPLIGRTVVMSGGRVAYDGPPLVSFTEAEGHDHVHHPDAEPHPVFAPGVAAPLERPEPREPRA